MEKVEEMLEERGRKPARSAGSPLDKPCGEKTGEDTRLNRNATPARAEIAFAGVRPYGTSVQSALREILPPGSKVVEEIVTSQTLAMTIVLTVDLAEKDFPELCDRLDRRDLGHNLKRWSGHAILLNRQDVSESGYRHTITHHISRVDTFPS